MTVETTARKQSFAGGQSALEFSFRALASSPEDIKVVAVSSGTETALEYGVTYSVTINTDGIGGFAHVTPSYSTAYTYTVFRETGDSQDSDYDDYNQFPADTLETDLDRRTMVSQEQGDGILRSVKVPVSSTLTGSSLELATPSAGKAIIWNATADGLTNSLYDSDSMGTIALNAATTASTAAAAALVSETNAGNYATTASTAATLAGNYATTASTAAATIPDVTTGAPGDIIQVNGTSTAYELAAAAAGGSVTAPTNVTQFAIPVFGTTAGTMLIEGGATLTSGTLTVTNATITGNLDVSGTVTASTLSIPNQGAFKGFACGARVRNSTAILIPTGTTVALTYDTETYDTDNIHNPTSNTSRLTAPYDGYYILGCHVQYNLGGSANTSRLIAIRKDGTTLLSRFSTTPADTGSSLMFTTTAYYFAAGEYAEVVTEHGSASNINVLTNNAYSPEFWMQKIG